MIGFFRFITVRCLDGPTFQKKSSRSDDSVAGLSSVESGYFSDQSASAEGNRKR